MEKSERSAKGGPKQKRVGRRAKLDGWCDGVTAWLEAVIAFRDPLASSLSQRSVMWIMVRLPFKVRYLVPRFKPLGRVRLRCNRKWATRASIRFSNVRTAPYPCERFVEVNYNSSKSTPRLLKANVPVLTPCPYCDTAKREHSLCLPLKMAPVSLACIALDVSRVLNSEFRKSFLFRL